MGYRKRGAPDSSAAFAVERGLVVWLLLLGFALFLYRLDAQSLWYDEAVSARLASMSLPALVRWTAQDIQPPLYYMLLHGWTRAAGRSEWALRFFSAAWAWLVFPLAYVIGRRLTHRWRGGVVAMALLGVAPWLVYYAQEARMYTMLLALGLGWAYAVLTFRGRKGDIVGFVGLGLALLYTHYFALFLLLALALWHLLFHPREGGRWRLWLGLGGLMGIGYLPWLPFLLHRFRVDASYWQGTLKVGEAVRHWWLHMTLGAPETFLESAALRWWPFFALITGMALGAHLWTAHHEGREGWARVGLLLFWWGGPTVAVLLLAYRTPKFNPRYLMLGYPAWVFLLSTVPFLPFPGRGSRRMARGAAVLLLGPWLLFARSDMLWFTDPAFTKPDFRGALGYLREHRRPDEAVFLVSGHMWPVVAYYAPELPFVPLPAEDVLDVTRVLDFRIAPVINNALRDARGAWVVLWQDEVVDPMGVVPYLLAHAGQEDGSVPNAFWHVRLRHYLLPPGARVPEQPPLSHRTDVNWGGMVRFLGVEEAPEGALVLFFQGMRPLQADFSLHMELWDEEGHFWGAGDARAGPYMYPAFRWQPGQIVLARYPLPAVPGTPAGVYTLRVRLYDKAHPSGVEVLDALGRPQGRDAVVSGIRVERTLPAAEATFPPLPPDVSPAGVAAWEVREGSGPYPAPWGVRVWPAPPWAPGQPVHMQIRWWSSRPPRPRDGVELYFRRGDRKIPAVRHPLAGLPSEGEWSEPGYFFTQMRVRVPADLSPGWWELCANVRVDGHTRAVVSLGTAEIRTSSLRFTPPPVSIPVGALLDGRIRLVGVDTDARQWTPGARVPITVTWEALAPIDRSYTAFVHVLGDGDRVIAQEDHVPGRGRYPTDTWIPGQFVQDRFEVSLPDTLPDRVVLEIGMYDAKRPGMPRVPVQWKGEVVHRAVRLVLPQGER